MSKDGPSSVHNICGVSAKIRAWCANDLDSHTGFIRKSLAGGMSADKVGETLGVTGNRIRRFAKKNRMINNSRGKGGCPSQYLSPRMEKINTLAFHPRTISR